jgi:hypothetical protein
MTRELKRRASSSGIPAIRESLGVLVEVAGESHKDLLGEVHQDAGVVVPDESRAAARAATGGLGGERSACIREGQRAGAAGDCQLISPPAMRMSP